METKTEEFYLNLIKSDGKLRAIKAYLNEYQCSIQDAKNFIDELENETVQHFQRKPGNAVMRI